MEFCIISPTAGLERYATLSKTHLVLSHITDIKYMEFYAERRVAGDFLILDNGAWENGKPHFSMEAFKYYRPQVFVLPDYPLQPWKRTWHAAIAFLDEWYETLGSRTEFLYIPQSTTGDIGGFLESYTEAVQDQRITWLGIPRALAYAIARTPNPLMRVEFARMVARDHPNLKLHAFGMVNGDIHELPYLAQVGVTSVDSSAPVWRGWNGFDINDTLGWNNYGTLVDFQHNAKGWEKNHALILHNLEACGVETSTARR